jgi:hypothetical protein
LIKKIKKERKGNAEEETHKRKGEEAREMRGTGKGISA